MPAKPKKGPTVKVLKCTPEYGDWLEKFAKQNRTTVAGLFDQSLVEYAKVKGYDAPPPRTPSNADD